MQGLILAAGMGRRLGKKTEDNTKCMIEVGGKRLVAHALDSFVELVEKGESISRVVLVIGYKGDNVIKEIGDDYKGIKIEYVDNPIYDKTNNIYSLWLARDYLKKDDTILLESDLNLPDLEADSCYRKVAVAMGDLSICKKSGNEDDCIIEVVGNSNDFNLCEKISDDQKKDSCYLRVVYNSIQK